jgi:hydroxymethylpyrimidine kinase/phosphomethylpyrimidine kinase
MPHPRRSPVVLTIAGSDSGGGAGIQADLKTFASLGLHGTCAITCLTAQNPGGVWGVQASRPGMVRQQVEAVFEELPPAAIKTGMLYSTRIIHEVARCLARHPRLPLVVDPVMVATSGASLLRASAIRALQDELLPRALLATPNLDEAFVLTGRRLRSLEDLRWAAREIQVRSGCAVLVKGGHLARVREAVDLLRVGGCEWLLSAPRTRGVSTHGTGCTYAAAITGYLALGCELPRAVALAKIYISGAIRHSGWVGRHRVLHWFWAATPRVGGRGRRRPGARLP